MTPDPQVSDPVNMLTKLPEELVMLVMAKLDPLSLANLERTSTALQSIIQEGNLWKRMADDVDKADPYPFITGMLRSEVSENSRSREFSTRVSFIFSRSTTRNDFLKSRSRLET